MLNQKAPSVEKSSLSEPSPAELEARASAAEFEKVEDAIERAEQFVRDALRGEGKFPSEVQEERNGLPEAAVSIALWRLINGGEVELGTDRIARLAEPARQNGHPDAADGSAE